MRTIHSIKALGLVLSLALSFVGCSKDDNSSVTPPPPVEVPDLVVGQESIRVKIGADNRAVISIEKGAGDYNAFTLDETIAKATKEGDKVYIEGFANGVTSLIVSDKAGRYRKTNINVYTTDNLDLQDTELELTAVLGKAIRRTTRVLLGNGKYFGESDNPRVIVHVNEETGEITVQATPRLQPYTAKVTIGDEAGLKTELIVTVKANLNPYTEEELTAIKEDASTRYYRGSTVIYKNTNVIRTTPEGKLVYGCSYNYGSVVYYDFRVSFSGDTSVGKKQNATLYYKTYWGVEFDEVPITLEVIKNDGTNVWMTYAYIDEEKEQITYGYLCSPISL